jgi:hypothetical protein
MTNYRAVILVLFIGRGIALGAEAPNELADSLRRTVLIVMPEKIQVAIWISSL